MEQCGPLEGRGAATRWPTLPAALDGILDQIGAPIVVVNVLDRDKPAHVHALEPAQVRVGQGGMPGRVARPEALIVADGAAVLTGGGTDYTLAGRTVTRPAAGVGAIEDTDRLVALYTDGSSVRHMTAAVAAPAAGQPWADAVPDGVTDVEVWRIHGDVHAWDATDGDWRIDDATGGLVTGPGGGIADGATLWVLGECWYHLGGVQPADVTGGVRADGDYGGLHALLAARERTTRAPRIIIAPGYSGTVTTGGGGGAVDAAPVMAGMATIAARLRAVAVVDGPDSDDADAVGMARLGNDRTYIVDPWPVVGVDRVPDPPSSRVAGVIARSDAERGYWWSPSNREILGITGTTRPVDYAPGSTAGRANALNEAAVATIIRPDAGGFRLWGNRVPAADPIRTFLSVTRTSDAIQERLLISHQWAVDLALTTTYVDEVLAGLQAFLRDLQGLGAILGGRAWVDPDLNQPTQIAAGKITFSLDFTPPAPAERVTIQAILTDAYLAEVV